MVGKSSAESEVQFGAALRRLRLAAGMSQERLGLEAGIQRNFVSLIETGQNQPTITTIAKLAADTEDFAQSAQSLDQLVHLVDQYRQRGMTGCLVFESSTTCG